VNFCLEFVIHEQCSKTCEKLAGLARNREFFRKPSFKEKIAEKIGRFFHEFLASFREKLASFCKNSGKTRGRWEKLARLKFLNSPRV
jgi:hypothetical protein